jgi:hypothetical protein
MKKIIKIRNISIVNNIDDSMNYDKVVNCIWVTVIVITTVGYGDYFPRTLLGRGILTLGAFWGSFVVSLLVLVLTNSIKSKIKKKNI